MGAQCIVVVVVVAVLLSWFLLLFWLSLVVVSSGRDDGVASRLGRGWGGRGERRYHGLAWLARTH